MKDVKKILIPTDFSVISLTLIRSALQQIAETEQIEIILAHGYRFSDSITELLFFSKRKIKENLETEEFRNACQLLKNTYNLQIRSIKVDFIIGNGKRSFSNYLDANQIDEIHYCENVEMELAHKHSFNLISLIKSINPKERIIQPIKIENNDYRLTNQISDLFQSSFTYLSDK